MRPHGGVTWRIGQLLENVADGCFPGPENDVENLSLARSKTIARLRLSHRLPLVSQDAADSGRRT